MKLLISILLLFVTGNCYGQASAKQLSWGTNIFTKDIDTNDIISSLTSVTPTLSGTLTSGSFRQRIYRDTIPKSRTYWDTPSTLNSTLKTEKGGGDGSPEHPDTTYIYNHFGYMLSRVNKEIDYWRIVHDKAWKRYFNGNNAAGLSEYLTSVKRIEYWTGVKQGIELVLFQQYTNHYFEYEFKTKK